LLSRMGPPGAGQHPHTIAVIGALAGSVAILVFLILGSGVPPPRSPGVVHTTEIKIAPEISGRLSRFAVTQGKRVREGDELAELVNPELSASLVLANADLGEAPTMSMRESAKRRSTPSNARSRRLKRICSMPSSNSRANPHSPLTGSPRARISTRHRQPSAPRAQGWSTRKTPTRPRGWGRSVRSWLSPMPR
jgi:HlyD family secretion protein